eukprot:4111648-Pyramimonas_sp.AAC.1
MSIIASPLHAGVASAAAPTSATRPGQVSPGACTITECSRWYPPGGKKVWGSGGIVLGRACPPTGGFWTKN